MDFIALELVPGPESCEIGCWTNAHHLIELYVRNIESTQSGHLIKLHILQLPRSTVIKPSSMYG